MEPVAQRSVMLHVFTGLTLLVAGFWAIVNFIEWFKVGVQGETAGYPFGGEGPVPAYYNSAVQYANTMLSWSIPFIVLALLGLWTFIKRKQVGSTAILGFTIIVWLLMYARGLSN